MKNKLAVTIFFLFSSQIIADEIKCENHTGKKTISAIEKLASDCALQKNLASDENVQKEHRRIVYEKLSTELANQIKQNSEDISLLTSFYNSNGQDLMMNSSEIAESCRLDSVKAIENCGGKKAGPYKELKLSLLKKKLPTIKNTPFSGDQSLYGIMAGKFYSDLGMNESGNDMKCPLEGSSGSFMIRSQLDESSAENIVDLLKNSKDSAFSQYAQLKVIKNTNDPQFIEKFKNYVRSIPAGVSAKEYISNFFFEKENQSKLAPTLANQCKRMNKNMNEFLCSDLTELGSLDDNTSKTLFNKLNTIDSMEDQYEVDFSDSSVLTAYGMQCIAKENLVKNPDRAKSQDFQSIDQWYEDFTNNTRQVEGVETSKTAVNNFCSTYNCKDKITLSLNSCKKGGPVNSAELSKLLGCDIIPRGKNCNENSLKTISYMKSLEKLKQGSKDQVIAKTSGTSSSATSTNDMEESNQQTIVSGRLPNFAENYFGVEGSLKALGKPVTVYEVTEKKKEFSENKLVSAGPIYSTPADMKKEMAQQQQNSSMTTAINTAMSAPTFTPTAMSQTTTIRPTFATPSEYIETVVKTKKAISKNIPIAETGMESSRLREEMEKMLADIKSTKQEMTETQNKMNTTSNTFARPGQNSITASPINKAEQERLRRLEQNLNEKSNRLDEYKKELDKRNFTQSGFGADGSAARSPTSGGSNNGTDANAGINGFSGNNGSGNSLKLSSTTNAKVDGKASGSNYTAAIIQSGVEVSTLTVDELSKLSTENLKNLGIDSSQPFTLKVIFDEKTYQVPVKSFVYRGTKILGPIMDPKNKALNDFLLKSPLFKDYINYRFEKEIQAKASI